MRWGRKRDSELRAALQRCQPRIRRAQAAVAALRARLVPVLAAHIPILDATECVALLEKVESILAGIGEGGGR